eukprot:351361-Prymnesium_polylepis.1
MCTHLSSSPIARFLRAHSSIFCCNTGSTCQARAGGRARASATDIHSHLAAEAAEVAEALALAAASK